MIHLGIEQQINVHQRCQEGYQLLNNLNLPNLHLVKTVLLTLKYKYMYCTGLIIPHFDF